MTQGPSARQSRLMHGVLDMCVLAVLDREPTHAYAVVQALRDGGFEHSSYGSIYPLTTRLEKHGLIQKSTRSSSKGPAKNMLSVTEQGRQMLVIWHKQWQETARTVDQILGSSEAFGGRGGHA